MKKQLILLIILMPLVAAYGTPKEDTHEQAARIVVAIQRADYEGNQGAMQRGFDELKPFLEDKELASRIRYWRGFAQWRRAINGFNDTVDRKELEQDLQTAIDEFKVAMELDPKFVDAKVGMISCLGYTAYIHKQDQMRAKELIGQFMQLLKEADEVAPDNPRVIWVHGPLLWNTPAERGGGQEKTIKNHQRGLEACSRIKPSEDPLEPSWGKPELMMSLAYCYLNTTTTVRDVNAAERYARGALEIIPYWHYMRDFLLPQVLAAKAKAK